MKTMMEEEMEDEMMAEMKHSSSSNSVKNVMIGLLIGGVAGALTMLLVAPQSGKQTRTLITDKTLQLRDETSKNLKEAFERVRKETNRLKSDVQGKAVELKQLGQDKLVEQLDRVSAALEAGKKSVEKV
jgi:gas vesicle protein